MNRNVWLVVVLLCAASTGAAAQDAAQATSDKAAADKTITVTGCVQNISSTAVSGSTEKGFLLTNAMMGTASTASAAATPGSTEGATKPSPAQQLERILAKANECHATATDWSPPYGAQHRAGNSIPEVAEA